MSQGSKSMILENAKKSEEMESLLVNMNAMTPTSLMEMVAQIPAK